MVEVIKINLMGNYQLLLLIVIAYIFVGEMSITTLNTHELTYNSLIEQLSRERAMQILDKHQKFQLIGYVFIPVIIFLKIFLVSAAFSTGEVFYNLKLSFSNAFRVALLSEPVFVVMAVVNIVDTKRLLAA